MYLNEMNKYSPFAPINEPSSEKASNRMKSSIFFLFLCRRKSAIELEIIPPITMQRPYDGIRWLKKYKCIYYLK